MKKESHDPSCFNNPINHPKTKRSKCSCSGQYGGANCQIFYPKSCKDYQRTFGYHHDGEYVLYLNWPECENGVIIYCAKMSSTTPLEYVTLPEGVEKNFAGDYNKTEGREEKTYFQKIRLSLLDRNVKKNDFTFATRNFPGIFRPYASARDCVSRSCHVQDRKGRFNVDLTGTSFHLPQVIPYHFHASPQCVRKIYAASMSEDQLRWSGKCGGSCGNCWPTKCGKCRNCWSMVAEVLYPPLS